MKKAWLVLVTILFALIIYYPAECEQDNSEIASNVSEKYGEIYHFDISVSTFTGDYSEEEMGDYQITFKGYLDAPSNFQSLCIGKGQGGPLGDYLYIDRDKMEVRHNFDNGVVDSLSHMITTWDKYVAVTIYAGNDGNAKIEVMTGGGYFSADVKWLSNYQNLFVTAGEATTLKNCTLTYHCNGWDKDIWLFGDSYFSLDEPDRWTTYLVNSGADNFMLNGRSGRGSEDALTSLKYDLQYGQPEMLVWCLGMNDGDEGSINESYDSVVHEVMQICDQNDIELVLATIPTCPYWNNDYKNEFVKNSGYRYIDFARAVGAYDSITWYDGMLEEAEKRIHPTETGAVALYSEAVTTVPELVEKK